MGFRIWWAAGWTRTIKPPGIGFQPSHGISLRSWRRGGTLRRAGSPGRPQTGATSSNRNTIPNLHVSNNRHRSSSLTTSSIPLRIIGKLRTKSSDCAAVSADFPSLSVYIRNTISNWYPRSRTFRLEGHWYATANRVWKLFLKTSQRGALLSAD
jgi:hypothetical protein